MVDGGPGGGGEELVGENVAWRPLDFKNGPGVGLQTNAAIFAAIAIATIAADVSTTEVDVQAIRATCTMPTSLLFSFF